MKHRDKYRSKVVGRRDRGHRHADGRLKRAFTEQGARDAVLSMQKRDRKQAVAAYPCRSCEFWHVGSTGRR